MAKFRELVEHLSYEELQKIRNDIETGAVHMQRIVNNKLRKKEVEHGQVCSVCMNTIDGFNVNNFTLIFGPDSYKKKASFCGIDCLKYFIANLETLKKGVHEHQDQQTL